MKSREPLHLPAETLAPPHSTGDTAAIVTDSLSPVSPLPDGSQPAPTRRRHKRLPLLEEAHDAPGVAALKGHPESHGESQAAARDGSHPGGQPSTTQRAEGAQSRKALRSLALGIGARRMAWILAAVAKNEHARRRGQPTLPYKLELMTTFACESRCKTCLIWSRYIQHPEDRARELDAAKFGQIAASVRSSVRWVSFTGGEVTDRDDFVDIVKGVVDAVGDRLSLINITTNGLNVERTRAVFAKVAAVTRGIPTFVTLSLDGTEDTYNAVRGVPGFHSVRASMAALRELGKDEPHLRTGYEATISALNAHNLEDLFEVMVEAGERPTFTQSSNALQLTSGLIDVDVRKQGPAVREALARAYELVRVKTPLDLAPKLYLALVKRWFATGQAPVACSGGHATLTIDPYGEVLQCNTRGTALADLKDYDFDLAAMVRSPEFMAALAPTSGCRECWSPCHAYPTLLHRPVAAAVEGARAILNKG